MRDRRPHIFISYRRADSAAVVDHLYDRLVAKYGRDCIFRDIDNIPLGRDFRDHIRTVIGECDVVLAIIGPAWTGGRGPSANRIMREDDPVRIEIEVAFEAGALVIPVLVGGGEMSGRRILPQSLEKLPSLNAATLATGRDFEHHLSLLFGKLDDALRRCGKSVLRRPQWLRPAAAAAAIVAIAPLLLFAASALFGIPFGASVVPVGTIVVALAGGVSLALLLMALLFSGRIAWPVLTGRPFFAVALFFVLVQPAFYWLATEFADAIPIRDTRHLSKRLLAEFGRARSQVVSTGRGDFTEARRIVDALREIDPDSGTAWYFSGEIVRVENARLFDSQSCFRGWPSGASGSLDPFQRDFHRYIATELALGDATRVTDWGTQTCYAAGKGYCPQRTAWIYHLLAHDQFIDAAARSGGARLARLTSARDHVRLALRYNRPEGGVGFVQCIDSSDLLRQIEAALAGDGRPKED